MNGFDNKNSEDLAREAELDQVKRALISYNFEPHIKDFYEKRKPTIANPLQLSEFIRGGIRATQRAEITNTLAKGGLPFIIGPRRVGKTTLAVNVAEASGANRILDMTANNLDEIKKALKTFPSDTTIVIDEAGIDPLTLPAIDAVTKAGNPILLSTVLAEADPLFKALVERGLKPEKFLVGPVPKAELAPYIACSLTLEQEDKLVAIITTLSGGSAITSSVLCGALIDESTNFLDDGDTNYPDFYKKWMSDVFYAVRHLELFENWALELAAAPQYAHLIPRPLLKDLKV